MTTYNTGNPIGSTEPRDLSDNSENFDNLINGVNSSYNDRLGIARKSWAGIEAQVSEFFIGSAYEFVGDYAAGIELTRYSQLVRDAGEFWRVSGSVTLPYTTTGAGLPEGGSFVAVGDAYLRQSLASQTAGQGASLVGMEGGPTVEAAVTQAEEDILERVIRKATVAEIEALTGTSNHQVSLSGSRAGIFKFDASNLSAKVTEDPQQGIYIAPSSGATGASGAFVRQEIDFSNIRAEWFGALINNSADDYTAWQAAINWAAQAFNGSQGATVRGGTGVSLISQQLNGPNRVAISGPNGRGLTFRPFAGFSSPYMFQFSNGTSSMFGSRLENCYVDARGFNMSAVIFTQAWQETCGADKIVIQYDGTTPYGILYDDGFGGAAYLPFRDIEIFSNSTAILNAGIRVLEVSLVGGFVLDVHGYTAAGTIGNPMNSAILMDNDSLCVKGLHIEYCISAVTMSGSGSLSADTLTGSANAVNNLISLGSGFTGKVSGRNLIPNGASSDTIRNNITGANVPASAGMIPDYVYPSIRSENAALAWVVFDGANGTILKSFNVSSVTRASAGEYTLTYSTSFPNVERAISWSTNVDSADAVIVTSTGGTTSTELIKVRRLGTYSGAYFDAQRVKITVFGNSVV
jgi:hypothetical protein